MSLRRVAGIMSPLPQMHISFFARKYYWLAAAAVLLCIVCWWLLGKNGNSEKSPQTPAKTERPTEKTEPAKTQANVPETLPSPEFPEKKPKNGSLNQFRINRTKPNPRVKYFREQARLDYKTARAKGEYAGGDDLIEGFDSFLVRAQAELRSGRQQNALAICRAFSSQHLDTLLAFQVFAAYGHELFKEKKFEDAYHTFEVFLQNDGDKLSDDTEAEILWLMFLCCASDWGNLEQEGIQAVFKIKKLKPSPFLEEQYIKKIGEWKQRLNGKW